MQIEKQLSSKLLEIENPSRYFPSEYIYGKKEYKNGMVRCAICFPDLYEIGMSNNSVKIIYNQLNNIDNVYCDRVFSVAPDFEKLLRSSAVPLFTLEQNFPLYELDFLGISIGSELAATNILQILDLGRIHLHADERTENEPIVIAGGPASTNPLPFARFFDFVYIGEAEEGLSEVISIISENIPRTEKIKKLKEFDFLWYFGKELAIRAVDTDFGNVNEEKHIYKHFAVPSFEVVQDHGTAEIMRGCPNGCRFCHAGQYYKPFRQRNLNKINQIVEQNVNSFGYREITLSSLSSGDYPDLDILIEELNKNWADKGVSFSLPSLKVSSFSLDILEKISEVRKSGLTFAVETPMLANQRSLNKEVYIEQLISIINEAKSRGWKLAKFYFMVGLPFVDIETEKKNITDFLLQIRNATKINMNINIGTFIPKAHTPFQWAEQLSMEESANHLKSIKHSLMSNIPGIKVSYHEPAISFLEGIISRGTEECATLIESAYNKGCRLDAWDEYLDFSKWEEALKETGYTVQNIFDIDSELPWDSVSMNVSKNYLKQEYLKASGQELTSICTDNCNHKCGVCSKKYRTVTANNSDSHFFEYKENTDSKEIPRTYRQVIIKYKKTGRAVLNSHINVMRQFEMAFKRASLDVKFTEGFNPKPKIEFVNPLSMGVYGDNELLLCELPDSQINESLIEKMNNAIAYGFVIHDYSVVPIMDSGKKISLASNLLGSEYVFEDIQDERIKDCLNGCIGKYKEFEIKSCNNGFIVHVIGEKNIFKSLFSEDLNKFYIAQNCKITRKKIELKEVLQ